MREQGKTVKEGTWIYNGRELRVRIVLSQVRYGSNEPDDPDLLRLDQNIPTYYGRYENAAKKWPAWSHPGSTVDEAVDRLEKQFAPHKITWGPTIE
jgi:hypothetical protein